MSYPTQSTIAWLKLQLSDITEEGIVHRFELWHAIEGEGGEKCQSFAVGETCDAEALALSIWDVAEHDANTRITGVPQRYVIQAWRKNAQDAAAVHPFVLRGRGQAALLGGDTEPPTEKGIIAHHLRHGEQMHRLMMQMTEFTANRWQRDQENLTRRAEASEAKFVELIELLESLKDRKAERELEAARELQRARRQDEVMGTVLALLPLLAAKFLGGTEAVAKNLQASTARDSAIGKILRNLSEEEAVALLHSLQPHNRLAFLELYKSYREDEEKAAAGKPAILRTNGTAAATPEKGN